MSRTAKQILIASIYLIVVLGISGGIYYSHNRPTCNDGKQDGKEEGVDCGTVACGKPCAPTIQPLSIQNVQMTQTPAGDTDVAVQIYNPNSSYGVVTGTYEFTPVREGVPGSATSQNFYMLPGQTKYMVLTSLKDVATGSVPTATIKNVEWASVSTPQNNPFTVGRDALTRQPNSATYEAVITNNSDFDFDSVDVSAVVTDGAGNLITTNITNLQTVLSHTDRSIKMTWPFPLPADAKVYLEVGTNVFKNDNFIKTNGTPQEFQQYY